MDIQYKEVQSLEDVATYAVENIKDGDYYFNFPLSCSIAMSSLKTQAMEDVTEEAKAWAAPECPKDLHINHGTFISDGLDHIISELKEKKTGNRALFSLISQNDISGSGDHPIPSFMLMQCSIDDGILYCTAYFRALEVSKFLRINLEEIRQKICEIYNEIPDFQTVKLLIFSFKAYSNSNLSTLRVPTLDQLSELEIFVKLRESACAVSELVREKAQNTTVVTTDSLEYLHKCVSQLNSENPKPNIVLIENYLSDAISTANQLKSQRMQNSHHQIIESLNSKLCDKLILVSEEIKQWD